MAEDGRESGGQLINPSLKNPSKLSDNLPPTNAKEDIKELLKDVDFALPENPAGSSPRDQLLEGVDLGVDEFLKEYQTPKTVDTSFTRSPQDQDSLNQRLADNTKAFQASNTPSEDE